MWSRYCTAKKKILALLVLSDLNGNVVLSAHSNSSGSMIDTNCLTSTFICPCFMMSLLTAAL